jgi:hypothetical protein
MFTLLDVMASDAGCRDEAWELVLEFADAEQATVNETAVADATGETIKACAFEVPAEAMLRCLSEAAEEIGEPSGLDLRAPSAQGVCFNDLPVPDPIQELLMGGAYDALPKAGGFRAGAFSGDYSNPWEGDEETPELEVSDELFNSLYPPFDPSNR